MNPVYTGKDVSYIDTKQAQRAIETAVSEAERLGTLAWLAGAPYPHAAAGQGLAAAGLRRPPRRHHRGRVRSGVPGPAGRLARGVGSRLRGARGRGRLPGPATRPRDGAALTVSVFNALARSRQEMARVTVAVPEDGTRWLEIRDAAGDPVPALAEGVRRREDGSLAEVTLTFAARDVPALGYRTYR